MDTDKGRATKRGDLKITSMRFGRQSQGTLYEARNESENGRIAILCPRPAPGQKLAEYGYRVLCLDHEGGEKSLVDGMNAVRNGIAYLRAVPGIAKVMLCGHSGGATLVSVYQRAAENGVSILQGPEKLFPCPNISSLLPADGMVLLDSNWGSGAMTLLSLDPAVIEEAGTITLDPALNLFLSENGYRREGAVYSGDFVRRFQKAQGERNNRVIDQALCRLRAIERGQGLYEDDEPFIVAGANPLAVNNKLFPQDPRLLSHTKGEWPLLHADGSLKTQIVHSVRRPKNDKPLTSSYKMGALRTTVREFLISYAVRTTDQYGYGEDTMEGIDWSSSYNCTPGNVRDVAVPTLIMGMTGGCEYLAAETIYENSAAHDKTLIFVEGASHHLKTAIECESFPGQYGDTEQTTFDYVDRWLSRRVHIENELS